IYTAHKYENSLGEKLKFYDNTEDFRNILIKIRDFSNEIGVRNFASIFTKSFELLDEKKYIINKEKFPLGFPDKNARLYVASMTANIFGGMGSWNDSVPYYVYEKGLTDEYNKLSNELREQMELATMYAINEW
ncbi:RNA polymerase subunit sigma, partial [Fusobacterium simiae]|nr:RNA polymerase subunit sigma [Fusobacterium simiae]